MSIPCARPVATVSRHWHPLAPPNTPGGTSDRHPKSSDTRLQAWNRGDLKTFTDYYSEGSICRQNTHSEPAENLRDVPSLSDCGTPRHSGIHYWQIANARPRLRFSGRPLSFEAHPAKHDQVGLFAAFPCESGRMANHPRPYRLTSPAHAASAAASSSLWQNRLLTVRRSNSLILRSRDRKERY